jgi:ABC-type multidrug transport system fused ATPase/permease subunit
LVINEVTFGYGDDEPVLQGVDLRVESGEMVGVVGHSGGGKTTLMSIVLGLLPPSSGTVTYGDRPVQASDPHWYATVAYVPQDVYVLDDTVVANVAMGDAEPDLDRIRVALDRAQLLTVVEALPEGLQTRLQEGGARLSVGQRQRLGIARALYREARILLLDEPTASLDSDTEGQVVETLLRLKGEVTMVVVAHRLSTIANADRVLRMTDGKLSDVP